MRKTCHNRVALYVWLSIDYLCSVIASKISLLRQISEYVPVDVQKTFYQGYILPYIDYGSVTWGSASTIHIERLSKLQKRAARIILCSIYIKTLETSFNLPSLQCRECNCVCGVCGIRHMHSARQLIPQY